LVKYVISKIINAPIKYVYAWATDYREKDNAIWGGKYPKIILLKTKRKAVYVCYSQNPGRKPKLGVRFVNLHPRTFSWNLDYYAEEDLETGEYKLTRLGGEKTKLTIALRNTWKRGRGPTSKEFKKHGDFVWQKYAEALERDYKMGKPP
jgi:hypothetical protein